MGDSRGGCDVGGGGGLVVVLMLFSLLLALLFANICNLIIISDKKP